MMFDIKLLRRIGFLTLLLFIWFSFSADFSFAQQEDELLKARRMYQQGDYEGSISVLSNFIDKLKTIAAQKKNVAEAFYLLAKVYYTVGEEEKVENNLQKVFETYPHFTKEETDLEFKDRVEKTRKEFLQKQDEELKQYKPLPAKEDQKSEDKKVIPKTVKKKKKRFPVLLVLGGLAVVGVVLYLILGKKSEDEGYDIRGTWNLNWNWNTGASGVDPITFSGGKNSGTFVIETLNGTWTVNGTNIQFIFTSGTTYNGTIYSNTYMGGTMIDYNSYPGTWTATRIGAKSKSIKLKSKSSGTANQARLP